MSLNRRIRRHFLQQITKEMMVVRKSFRDDLLTKNTNISDATWETGDYKAGQRKPTPATPPKHRRLQSLSRNYRRINKHKVIREINDYIRVDDFYTKLAKRNSEIKKNPTIENFELKQLNWQCLDLAENALTKIDWSKYR